MQPAPPYRWPATNACAVAEPAWQKLELPPLAHLQNAAAPDDQCGLWLTGFTVGVGQAEEPAIWQSHSAGVGLRSRRNLGVDWVDSIGFADAHNGWIAGPLSASAAIQAGEPGLLHTTDTGANWNVVHLPRSAAGRLSELSVVPAENLVLVKALYNPPGARFPGGVLLASDDVGQTWREALRLPPSADRDSAITQVEVSGSTIMVSGFQAGSWVVEASPDRGRSFVRLPVPAEASAINLVD